MRQARAGCSGLFAVLLLGCLAAAVFYWPSFIDARGTETHATISEKREMVRVHAGAWYRRFQIIAAYSVPGQPLERHAICDVDQPTYDTLHMGNPVTVHYIEALLAQPFVSATNISTCSSLASINLNPSVIPKLVMACVSLLVILFIGAVLRAPLLRAVFLLLWFLGSAAYFMTPRAEPTPSEPHNAQATVNSMATITAIPDNSRHSITLSHPFQIVELKFTPPGMDGPVTAIDKIDLNSIPNLQPGRTVDISYDAANPRMAALRGGTRLFPQHFLVILLILGAIVLLPFFLLALLRFVFRPFARNPVGRAARVNAFLQRNRPRRF